MPGWVLAIDFGTTSTAAAMRFDDHVQMVAIDGAPHMPSMVFWREGTVGVPGELVLGRRVDNLASRAPWCLERSPKRRIGEEFMQLGEQNVRVTDAISAILLKVASEASRLRGGQRPAEVRLTHPVRWGEVRVASLRRAAADAGFVAPVLLPEPVAAATYFASERLEVGEHVAVYDLGGGTFDTAVLKRTAAGFEVVGRPGGREDLGGENFDDLLYRHLGGQLSTEHWRALRHAAVNHDTTGNIWREANFQLQREARVAKEILSDSPDYEVRVPVPVDAYLPVTAAELKELVRADLEETVVELRRSIESARIKPSELAAIYLAGGSSRIPLVSELIKAELGQTPDYLEDPKSVIALGAARAPIGAYDLDERASVPRGARTTVRADRPSAPPPGDTATRPLPSRAVVTSPPAPPGAQIRRRRVLLLAAVAGVLGLTVVAILVSGSGGGPAPPPPGPETPATGDVRTLVAEYARARSAHDPVGLRRVLAPTVRESIPGATGGLENIVNAAADPALGTVWAIDLGSATVTTGPDRASLSGRYTLALPGAPLERGTIDLTMQEKPPGPLRITTIARYPDKIYRVKPNGQSYVETDHVYVNAGGRPLLGVASMAISPSRDTEIYVPLAPAAAALLQRGTQIVNRRTFSDHSPPRTDTARYRLAAF